jgi:hypothetical protein
MNYGSEFKSGGAFGIVGIDFEFRLKPKHHQKLYFTMATGISYLKNGFYSSESFAYTSWDLYTQEITDMTMQYWQVPVMLRIIWQPFPLVEDWKLFFGAGICNNILVKSTLYEKHTDVIYNVDILAPPTTTQYQDRGDITELGKQNSLFRRFEIGMNYKRIQVTFRLSKSITDLYHEGLEQSWAVPDEDSGYISAHMSDRKTTEKYTELVIGYRIGK